MAPKLVLVKRAPRTPGHRAAPRWFRKRLDHEVDKSNSTAALDHEEVSLNEESLAMGLLFEHASTHRREQLYEFLRVNGCECMGCTRHRAYGDQHVRETDASREAREHAKTLYRLMVAGGDGADVAKTIAKSTREQWKPRRLQSAGA